ncbi:hypothetical protein QO004_000063 [Rhizobium mesoamericanum]|nr:hypothetical protein [Rhizobium mesoamericanum]
MQCDAPSPVTVEKLRFSQRGWLRYYSICSRVALAVGETSIYADLATEEPAVRSDLVLSRAVVSVTADPL